MQPSRFVQYSARAVDLSLGTEESLMALKTTKVASHHGETRKTDGQTGETKRGTSNKRQRGGGWLNRFTRGKVGWSIGYALNLILNYKFGLKTYVV